MLIVIGSETKKSLSWFLQFRWGPGVEVEVFMRLVSQITIRVDLTSVEFDYWVTNVELG